MACLFAVHGVQVAADPDIDMARHVHKVARSRHQLSQSLGTLDGAFRVELFHCVNEEVASTGVLFVYRDHRLKTG